MSRNSPLLRRSLRNKINRLTGWSVESVMKGHIEEIWYLLNIFRGFGYLILFVLAMIWFRLFLMIDEDATGSGVRFRHKFIHPPTVSRETGEQDEDSDLPKSMLPNALFIWSTRVRVSTRLDAGHS
jgi:hypothetical protein